MTAPVTVAKIRLNSPVMDSADSPIKSSHPASDGAQRRAVWQASAFALFLPALVVAAGYGALWAALYFNGRGDGALARVCLMVLILVVPSLLAYAGLRLSTTRLTLRGAHLEVHPGFPARDPVSVAYAQVTGLSLRNGLSGWITGAGSLVIERNNGSPVVVSGLSSPNAAMDDLSARCKAFHRPSAAF
ncbi:PH domain-containing protein [Hoeflea sp. AS60]|uniref:PH domain-containing protein n=1 Tax=Hoeflea sp. AS60 TaxID=3135780 RepID=UPI003172BC7C